MCYGIWKHVSEAPEEYQKVTASYKWNNDYQLAAGTYHDETFYQDGGDMERKIDGVEWWTGHFPVPPLTGYSSPWKED